MAGQPSFTFQALDYAKNNKSGLLVGLQTGVAVFPVLVSNAVDPAAVAWAKAQQRVQFACMARPVIVDADQLHMSSYCGKPVLGRFYASYLIEKSERYFRAPGWKAA